MDRKMRARRNNLEARASRERRATRKHSPTCECCGRPEDEHVAISFDPSDPRSDELLETACEVVLPKEKVN